VTDQPGVCHTPRTYGLLVERSSMSPNGIKIGLCGTQATRKVQSEDGSDHALLWTAKLYKLSPAKPRTNLDDKSFLTLSCPSNGGELPREG
jgi:hypothetical protein